MKVFNPIGDIRYVEKRDKLAPRLSELTGKVIGFVSNGAGTAYFQRIEELLAERANQPRLLRR